MGQIASKVFWSNQTDVNPNVDTVKKEHITSDTTHMKLHSFRHRQFRSIENFIIIWLDSNIDESNEDIQHSISHLRRIVNSILTFTDANNCIDYLTEVKNEKIFVIVSGSLGQRVVPLMSSINQLIYIYVFCGDKGKHQQWASNFPKVKGVFNQIQDLCNELKVVVHQSEKDLMPISIISSSLVTNLNELDSSFMYSLLLKEILLENQSTLKEKNELVDFCRLEYDKNEKELKVIEEFKQRYPDPSAICWYTRECFLYNMLNKALRTHDIVVIMKMGFVIRDIHRHIEQLQTQQNHRQKIIVYRGQRMSHQEFNKIKKSKGGLLAFNNFLSTSIDRAVGLRFALPSADNPDITAVLFQIDIDPNISAMPFASVDEVSYEDYNEKEILFTMNTIFRIRETKEIDLGLYQVDLSLTNDNDQQLSQVTQAMRVATRGPTGVHRMAKLMVAMGKFEKAEEIYISLIETISNDDRQQLAHFHHQLGYINDEKKDLTSALSHYNKSLDIYLTYMSPDDPRLCETLSNIGSVLKQQGNLSGAWKHYKRALDIDLHSSQPDQTKIAIHHSNIGMVLKDQGKYDEALKSYECALQIGIRCLPAFHPSLASTYNNISGVYRAMGDDASAFSYIQKTLEIKQKSLPPHHPSLAATHKNMANVLESLNRTAEAIKHAEQAVEIGRHSFSSDNPTVLKYQLYLDELRRKV